MSGVSTSVPAAPVVAVLVAIETVALLAVARRNGRLTALRVLTALATAAWSAALLALTLFPLQVLTGEYGNRAPWTSKVQLVPLITIDARTFVLNIVLFMPFGVLWALQRRGTSWQQIAVAGLVFSLAIEIVQGASNILVSSGRVADVNDLVANTAGALAGYGVFLLARRVRPAVLSPVPR